MLNLIVSLWLREGASVEAFEAFEREAQRLLTRHGGSIDRCWRPSQPGPDDPFELHLVSFPGHAELSAYLADPGVKARAAERERLIARTTVLEVASADYLST